MSDFVMTARGEMARAELTFVDTTREDATAIYTTRQWFAGTEQVRQDSWVDLKRGLAAELTKGN